jgi:hypothetical protein
MMMSRLVSALMVAFALVSVALLSASQAVAQPAQARRIRGTLESLSGNTLVVKSRDGADVTITLADNYGVTGYTKKQLSDIAFGDYVGVTATPQPDGSQKAISINVFPESARGAGDGHRPWTEPNTTMTNGAVAEAVATPDGQTLLVKYKDGEKKIVVTPTTPIAAFSPGETSDLKPGVAVTVSATTKPDGSLAATRVGFGRDGFVPN